MTSPQQQQQQPQAPVMHLNVQCDECGEDPIMGIRYKSKIRRNYDVCSTCLKENHGGVCDDKFIAFERRVGLLDTRPIEPTTSGRSISCYSFQRLVEELDRDELIEDCTLYLGPHNPPSHGKSVEEVIAKHTGMKCFHIYVRGSIDDSARVLPLIRGLKRNKSVVSLSWSILASTTRTHLAEEVSMGLKDLMETNETIKYFFVKRPRGYTSLGMELEDDSLVNHVFDGLEKCSLQTFRFSGLRPVSDHNKKKAWRAMTLNPHIKRIEANFLHGDCQLEILTADKKNQWMQRWTELESSSEGRLSVLEEVQGSGLDAVPALYHFIRNQPNNIV